MYFTILSLCITLGINYVDEADLYISILFILWFNDSDDKSKPMNIRTDEHNPDPKENGKIYEPKTGRQWSSVAHLTDEGLLYVKV